MKGRYIKAEYSLMQILYWMSSAASMCFTAAYLSSCGYNNMSVGLVCALSDIAVLILTLPLTSIVDAKGKNALFFSIAALSLLQIAGSIALVFPAFFKLSESISFGLIMAACQLQNIMYTRLYVDLDRIGAGVSYSVSRGLGSIAFGTAAAFIGSFSEKIVPFSVIIASVPQLIILLFIRNRIDVLTVQMPDIAQDPPSGNKDVIDRRSFAFLLLGITMVFSANTTINTFMINIVKNVGGSVSTLGYLTFFLAASELAAMLLYKPLRKRHTSTSLLLVGILFFPIKILCIFLAQNIAALFCAFSLQALSFGLYTPAIVDFANEHFPYKDSAKVQGLVASGSTVGSVFAVVLSGAFFDHYSVKCVLIILLVCAAAGAAISCCSLFAAKK